jgi:hypothetical protein
MVNSIHHLSFLKVFNLRRLPPLFYKKPMIPEQNKFDEQRDEDFSFSPRLIKELFLLTEHVERFEPHINGLDQDWQFHIKLDRQWQRLDINVYRDVWYCSISPGITRSHFTKEQTNFSFCLMRADLANLREEILAEVQHALPAINQAIKEIYDEVSIDPLKYNSDLLKKLPPTIRWGAIPSPFVRDLLPEWMPFLKELTPAEIQAAINICERGSSEPLLEMTAGTFFDYARVAYLANPGTFKDSLKPLKVNQSGIELYKLYADGRDDGLTKLNQKSPKAFEDWYSSSKRGGGHPWEIYRGGNSTHIDLYVERPTVGPKNSWQIKLSAFSSTRLAETCRIAIAFAKADLPFKLEHADSYLARLRGEDMVGIIPTGFDLKYGYHAFPKEFGVADCIHFSWLKDSQGRQLAPWRDLAAATTWLPIRPLRAR